MEIHDAFRKAIKSYFEDHEYEQMETMKNRKYTKKYFDDFAKESGLGEKESPLEDKLEGGIEE